MAADIRDARYYDRESPQQKLMLRGQVATLLRKEPMVVYILEDGRFAAPWGNGDWKVRNTMGTLVALAQQFQASLSLWRPRFSSLSIDDVDDKLKENEPVYEVVEWNGEKLTTKNGNKIRAAYYDWFIFNEDISVKIAKLRAEYTKWAKGVQKQHDKFEAQFDKLKAKLQKVSRNTFKQHVRPKDTVRKRGESDAEA
jgi:hypothetical protein